MPANLLTDLAWFVSAFGLTAAGVSSIIRSLVSLCRKMVEERSRTARFNAALKDSTPQQRAVIILACGQLEGGRASEPTTGEPEEASQPAPERFFLIARFLRGRCETERGK